jgi:hypothetical protein
MLISNLRCRQVGFPRLGFFPRKPRGSPVRKFKSHLAHSTPSYPHIPRVRARDPIPNSPASPHPDQIAASAPAHPQSPRRSPARSSARPRPGSRAFLLSGRYGTQMAGGSLGGKIVDLQGLAGNSGRWSG